MDLMTKLEHTKSDFNNEPDVCKSHIETFFKRHLQYPVHDYKFVLRKDGNNQVERAVEWYDPVEKEMKQLCFKLLWMNSQ